MLEDSCQVGWRLLLESGRPISIAHFKLRLYHGGYEKDLSALRYDPEGGRLEADPIAGQRCPPF